MSSTEHLQSQPERWADATDEQIIEALFLPVRFVNPFWMAWLERERSELLNRYLRLWAVGGGRAGAPSPWFQGGRR